MVKTYDDKKPVVRKELLQMMERRTDLNDIDINKYYNLFYETMLAKIQEREEASRIIRANIVNETSRTVKLASLPTNLSRIRGTTDYFRKINNEVAFLHYYNGFISLNVTVSLDKDVNKIWKSFINHEQKVAVTEDETGNYTVHLDHCIDTKCQDSCQKTTLEQYNLLWLFKRV